MRQAIPFLALIVLASLFGAGCTGPEEKLGRGITNVGEVGRLGELRHSYEQAVIFDNGGLSHSGGEWVSYAGTGYAAGVVRGIDRSVARTGLGVYEVITFPLPPYHPIWTSYLAPGPVYPDSYVPRRAEDPSFDTDTFTGFSGGDVTPFIPGSRFNVFDN